LQPGLNFPSEFLKKKREREKRKDASRIKIHLVEMSREGRQQDYKNSIFMSSFRVTEGQRQ
jgi:hypothetical protein